MLAIAATLQRQAKAQSRVGQLAAGGRYPQFLSGSVRSLLSRVQHHARDTMAGASFLYLNHFGSAEASPGQTARLYVWVEYPSGHFHQLTFAGQLSAYLQDGAERLSDPLPVSIPAGARFWEWTYYEGTTGVLFCMTNNQVDAAILGEPVPPRWPVPGMAPSSRVYGATAIIGVTDRPAILLLGDSRAAGTMGGSIGNDGGNVLPSISRDFAFINAAVPGETLWQALTAANHRRSLARFCSHVVISGGVNDLMGTDAQQVIETVTRLVATFPLPVFLVTVEPFSSGGFQAADGGDQVINPIFEARRRLYNQAVRDGIPGAAGYFDIASLAELPGHPGKWRPGLTEDGLHGNGEFARHVVSSRVISAEVFRR